MSDSINKVKQAKSKHANILHGSFSSFTDILDQNKNCIVITKDHSQLTPFSHFKPLKISY